MIRNEPNQKKIGAKLESIEEQLLNNDCAVINIQDLTILETNTIKETLNANQYFWEERQADKSLIIKK